MSYIVKGGAYANEDKYAQVFMRAYNELTPMERKIVYEARVNGDARLYSEYLKIVVKLANSIFDEDESLGILVYRRMLPNVVLETDEDVKAFNDKMKSKVK